MMPRRRPAGMAACRVMLTLLTSQCAITFPGYPVVIRRDAASRTLIWPVLETGSLAAGSSLCK